MNESQLNPDWWNDPEDLPMLTERSKSIELDRVEVFTTPPLHLSLPLFNCVKGEPILQKPILSTCVSSGTGTGQKISEASVKKRTKRVGQKKKKQVKKGKRKEAESEDESEGDLENDGKMTRQERNRICAKESRRRKKDYIKGLEGQV